MLCLLCTIHIEFKLILKIKSSSQGRYSKKSNEREIKKELHLNINGVLYDINVNDSSGK